MRVFAIDPGNVKSALCIIDAETLRPLYQVILPNENILRKIRSYKFDEDDEAAIEMLQSYGNLIGRDVLETAVWIGRFYEAFIRRLSAQRVPHMIFRMQEKMHICQDSRAGDSNIRRALIDRFCDHDFKNGKGTLKNPDWFFGFSKDMWAAYAVGLTYIENDLRKDNEK